jgi:3-dehydroquinate synthetase
MQLDKKTRDSRLQFVLPTRIGAVEFGCRVAEADLRAVLVPN